MRIISGKWKGKRLTAPKNIPTRPTTDFAKEGLFNIINHRFYIEDLEVLDLFGGIGSISFEFASRGAQKVMCVEKNRTCAYFIESTATQLDLPQIHVVKEDVFSYLKQSIPTPFDVIFADPPFDLEESEYEKLINLIFENGWLKENGTLILEHHKKMDVSIYPFYQETKKYSNIHFSFFSR